MHLHIFQLEGYEIGRFLKWMGKNFFKRKYEVKKPLVWTGKAKFIFLVAVFYALLTIIVLILKYGVLGCITGTILTSQAYIFLILGFLTLKPYEIINRKRTKHISREKIQNLKDKGLEVIGITGSYGKTSVKDFLYQILSQEYSVLKTPESYNTLFGISKVVDLELDNHYKYFICEMGAYKIGEIKELCQTFLPDHAILTGINEQHLERFGCIENTIQGKFEIMEYSDSKGIGLVNGNNGLVMENYKKYRENSFIYAKENGEFRIENVETTPEGSFFDLVLQDKVLRTQTPLVGKSNLENILAGASMAYLLGMSDEKIVEAIKKLKPVPHRLEIKNLEGGISIIDDSYNSNVNGFKAALDLLNSMKTENKVLVTPGIVELGDKTAKIHRELGALAEKICDLVVLVGKSERTQGLEEGIGNLNKIRFIDSITELDFSTFKKSVVLIENDLTENY